MRPIGIELFSGVGGLSLGLEQAGFDIALAIDRDPYHIATHKRNFPYGRSVVASAQDLSGDQIREMMSYDGDIDLVAGGPPCQGFSNMGLGDRGDPRNTLVDEFARLVSELTPKTFVMENVPGMSAGKTRPTFERFVERMRKAGYEITWPVKALNAADFGVPQQRRRLFVLGMRNDVGEHIEYPDGLCEGQPRRPTVWEAIADLPDVDVTPPPKGDDQLPYSNLPAADSAYAQVARGFVSDPSDLSRRRKWDPSIATGCIRVHHADKTRRLYESTRVGTMVPGHKLPRLDPDGLAPTLRAGTDSERGSHTAPRPVHPYAPRVITPREAARLHGFPDWFAFYPTSWHAYRQIGNAVCPPVARAIGMKVLKAMGVKRKEITRGRSIKLSLPIERPKTEVKNHRRLSVLDEFPKVINELWNNAFDGRRHRLIRPTITSADIKAAMLKSGAQLPRVRPERFLYEASRSRGVLKLLSVPLAEGYSIRILPSNDGSGEFVPSDSPECITHKDSIAIRSAELVDATELPLPAEIIQDPCRLAEIIEHHAVAPLVSKYKWRELRVNRDLYGAAPCPPFEAYGCTKKKNRHPLLVLSAKWGRIPSKSRIANLLAHKGNKAALVVCALTEKHVMVVLLKAHGGTCVEVSRHSFYLSAQQNDPSSMHVSAHLEAEIE